MRKYQKNPRMLLNTNFNLLLLEKQMEGVSWNHVQNFFMQVLILVWSMEWVGLVKHVSHFQLSSDSRDEGSHMLCTEGAIEHANNYVDAPKSHVSDGAMVFKVGSGDKTAKPKVRKWKAQARSCGQGMKTQTSEENGDGSIKKQGLPETEDIEVWSKQLRVLGDCETY